MLIALTPLLMGLGPAAVLVAMAVVFAETGLLLGFFLPGDSLLFTVGLLAAVGVFHLPVALVLAGMALAAVVGDQVGYLIGRALGPRVFGRESGSRWFRARHAERAREFFDRHGPKAVILARFVPVVRTFTPVAAGVAGMPRRRFTQFNVVGAVLWSVLLVGAGIFLGGVPVVAAHVDVIVIALAALSVLPAAIAYLRRRRSRRPAAAGPEAPKVPVSV
jgi:membrane protein DedA with SNARE-associated domain